MLEVNRDSLIQCGEKDRPVFCPGDREQSRCIRHLGTTRANSIGVYCTLINPLRSEPLGAGVTSNAEEFS